MKFRSDIKVELIDSMGTDTRVVQAARVSTKGAAAIEEQEGGVGLIHFLMREKHMVPFEHCLFTFYINAPIFVTRQFLKHRISSISEESGRYRELEGEFYVPADGRPIVQIGKTGAYNFIQGTDEQKSETSRLIKYAGKLSWGIYRLLIGLGISKEVARMVLPVNIYSSMFITVNAVSLMNIIRLRTSTFGSHPQHEIELAGRQMEAIFKEKMPVTYAAFIDTIPLREEDRGS